MFSIYFIVSSSFLVHQCRAFNVNFKTSDQEEIPSHLIETWLKTPIQDIPYLNLMLRSTNYQQDVENAYTQWFLKQTLVPLTLNSYELFNNISEAETETETPPKMPIDRDNYVIVTSFRDLRFTAQYFAQRSGIYFFVVRDAIDLQELRDICHILWTSFQIFRNFILTANGVLIYDPFAVDDRGEYGQIIQYTGELSMERTLFYNMRGYPLRVQIFKSVYSKPRLDPETKKVKFIYGVDGRVADVIQHYLNFTMNLLDPDPDYFGERAPNGTYNGAIGSIIKNELDLCLSGFFVKDYMVPEMDFSVAVYDDKLCIYTPKAKQIPESILPILSVGYDLWLGFILTAFACSFIWATLRWINLRLYNKYKSRVKNGAGGQLDSSFKWQYIRILIDTWVVWVRVNVTRYPPFSSEKAFIASLCLVSVIFGAIFESSLATVYIHPMYYSDIHTMEDLDKSGLHVTYKYTSMGDDLFFSETSPLFANLNKKLRHLKDLDADVMKDVAVNGDMAGVTRYTTLMLESLAFTKTKQVWIVPECPKYYTISYVWPKDSPWDDTVNQLLLRMLTGGLFNKFIADMQEDVDIKIGRRLTVNGNEGFKVLTIGDLQLAFYVIVIGSLMALISLLVERRKRSTTAVNHRLTSINT